MTLDPPLRRHGDTSTRKNRAMSKMPTQQDWINVLTAVLILLLLIICFVVIINVVEVIAHAITKVIDS